MTLKSILALIFACSTSVAHAGLITFENRGVPGSVSSPAFVTDGYQFSDNTDVADVSSDSPFGYATEGGHSGIYAAFNDFGGPMVMGRFDGGLFSVSSLWMHGFFGSSDAVVIEGFFNNQLLGTVNTSFGESWEEVALNFLNIDTLTISSNGLFYVDDIGASANGGGGGNVPEPGSLALIAVAACAAALARRARR
jgi:hypothetical protein